MRKVSVCVLALMLAGCAGVPKPSVMPHKAPVAKTKPAPVEQSTPNQIVKKRWYDRFKKHPKWFHSK